MGPLGRIIIFCILHAKIHRSSSLRRTCKIDKRCTGRAFLCSVARFALCCSCVASGHDAAASQATWGQRGHESFSSYLIMNHGTVNLKEVQDDILQQNHPINYYLTVSIAVGLYASEH